MRVIFLPTTTEGWVSLLVVLGLILGIALGITLWQRLWPSAVKKVAADPRYHQALAVYADHLPGEEPTRDDRLEALAAATLYLVNEHGIPSAEAAANMRLAVAAYDREQSYELRHQGAAYEQAGDYESALVYYERAVRLQEEHDPKDCQILRQCAARVRRKVRAR